MSRAKQIWGAIAKFLGQQSKMKKNIFWYLLNEKKEFIPSSEMPMSRV